MTTKQKNQLKRALKSSNMISALDIQLTGLSKETVQEFAKENDLEYRAGNRFGGYIYFTSKYSDDAIGVDALNEMLKP